MNLQERSRWVDDLRNIPLTAILLAAGAEQDLREKAKWQTARGVLSVTGTKFIHWKQGHGGGGAIDLAMHLNATDFNSALQWLAERFPSPGPSPAQPQTGPPLALPPPAPARLPGVTRYLAEQRRLPDTLLAPLLQTGGLYADARANAVFLLRGNTQRPVGAELRGTTSRAWHGLAPGSRKDLGCFAVGPPHSHDVILCEGAIDAISCAAIHPGCLCLSTAGARPNPAWLTPLIDQGRRILCGFDADPTGDHMAAAMITLHPCVQRLRPPLHDWNDVLVASA